MITYGEADESMLFRGIVTADGTEYCYKYADSRTQVTQHRDTPPLPIGDLPIAN